MGDHCICDRRIRYRYGRPHRRVGLHNAQHRRIECSEQGDTQHLLDCTVGVVRILIEFEQFVFIEFMLILVFIEFLQFILQFILVFIEFMLVLVFVEFILVEFVEFILVEFIKLIEFEQFVVLKQFIEFEQFMLIVLQQLVRSILQPRLNYIP